MKNIPPKDLKRNGNNLLDIDYEFLPTGHVNWRAMVPKKAIVLNQEQQTVIEETYKDTLSNLSAKLADGSLDEGAIDDKHKLILLDGFKAVAKTRGFTQVETKITHATPEFVSATCYIGWLPNYETHNQSIVTTGSADCHPNNTNGFGKLFLTAIAENRAFVRCVRTFLDIPIIGKDEVNSKWNGNESVSSNKTNGDSTPHAQLKKVLNKQPRQFNNFEEFRNWCLVKGFNAENTNGETWDANKWGELANIPKLAIVEILGSLQNGDNK